MCMTKAKCSAYACLATTPLKRYCAQLCILCAERTGYVLQMCGICLDTAQPTKVMGLHGIVSSMCICTSLRVCNIETQDRQLAETHGDAFRRCRCLGAYDA